MSSKSIARESFSRCGETCPAVDDAAATFLYELNLFIAPACCSQVEKLVDTFVSTIKVVGTDMLRSALDSCVDDRQALEEEVEDLRKQLDASEKIA